jgi:hypothetical protein
VFGRTNLRFGSLNIRAAVKRLFERILKAEIGRGQEGHVIGEFVFIAWRQSSDPGQNDLLLGHFIFERDDSLLLRKLFDFAPVDIDLRHQPHTSLLLRLLKECSRGVELQERTSNHLSAAVAKSHGRERERKRPGFDRVRCQARRGLQGNHY